MNVRELCPGSSEFGAMVAALFAAELPTEDLKDSETRCYMLGEGQAFGGVTMLGPIGLLRSVVVPSALRSAGSGSALVHELVTLARAAGIRELWLLTTSAEPFFERLGFERIDRAAAPASIAATGQFTGLCPASAIVMRKQLA